MATMTVVYPAKEGAKFDMDYYLKSHMPLVEKTWKSYGLKSWHVTKADAGGPYSVQATLFWDKKESVDKALKENSKEVFDDVKNFSSEGPTPIIGEVLGSSS